VTRDEYDGMDIGRELRAARPEPTGEFSSRLVDRVRVEQPRRRVAPRAVLAFATTVVALAVAAAFGGVSEAAFTIEGAVSSIVHVGHKAKPHHASTATNTTTSASSTSSATASHPKYGGGPSQGAALQPPPRVQPPGSPSQDQYNSGCNHGFRGPYIACHAP
jgi:hypothetical protein